MRKTFPFVLFLALIAGFGAVAHAAPPVASNLRDAWQGVVGGKCGTLVEKNGAYEFILDELSPRQEEQCVSSVGTDVVVFEPNSVGSMLGSPKEYLIVPLERIILRIRR